MTRWEIFDRTNVGSKVDIKVTGLGFGLGLRLGLGVKVWVSG